MTLYRYKAVTAGGEVREAEIEAISEDAVLERLRSSGHMPIRISLAGRFNLAELLHRDLFEKRRPSLGELASLGRQMATLLQAGLPLDRSLEIAIELCERRRQRMTLQHVLDGVRGGASLGEAVAAQPDYFPRIFVNLVRAGEASGHLDSTLERLAEYLERAEAISGRLRSALMYPAIVLALAGASLLILFTFVLPQFRPFFEGANRELPMVTVAVLMIGDAVEQYWWAAGLGLIAVFFVGRSQLRKPVVRQYADRVLLRTPMVGALIAKIEVARLSRTLGTLLANGVTLLAAMNISREAVANSVVRGAIDSASSALKEGKGLAEPLRQAGVLPPLAMHLIRVGEEAGRLDEMLLKVANIFDQQVQQSIERLLGLLTPVLTIALGAIVAVIIGSIMTAILGVYDLAN